jgi:hypothetical protein
MEKAMTQHSKEVAWFISILVGALLFVSFVFMAGYRCGQLSGVLILQAAQQQEGK